MSCILFIVFENSRTGLGLSRVTILQRTRMDLQRNVYQ
jgi:hypothetical protein